MRQSDEVVRVEVRVSCTHIKNATEEDSMVPCAVKKTGDRIQIHRHSIPSIRTPFLSTPSRSVSLSGKKV